MITPLRPGDLVRCTFSARDADDEFRACFPGCIFRVEKLYLCNDKVPFAFIRLIEGTCESRVVMSQTISMQRVFLQHLPPLVQLARVANEN